MTPSPLVRTGSRLDLLLPLGVVGSLVGLALTSLAMRVQSYADLQETLGGQFPVMLAPLLWVVALGLLGVGLVSLWRALSIVGARLDAPSSARERQLDGPRPPI